MPELYKYSYRVLTLDLTAGLTDFELPIDAEKIVYASPVTGPELSIRLQAKSNDQIPLRPQGEIIAPFQRLYISASATPQTIKLLIGSPADIQLTGRDVTISGFVAVRSMIENAMNTGQLFGGGLYLAPLAANFNKIEIRNPAGSNKTVFILDWRVSVGAPMVVRWGIRTAIFATLYANARNLDHNIFTGGATQIYTDQNPANTLNATNLIADTYLIAGIETAPRGVISLPAGSSFIVEGLTLNTGLGVNCEVWEKPN